VCRAYSHHVCHILCPGTREEATPHSEAGKLRAASTPAEVDRLLWEAEDVLIDSRRYLTPVPTMLDGTTEAKVGRGHA
jgi:hypothetical protein